MSQLHVPSPVGAPPVRALVLGGARSGKSSWAESRMARFPEVTYVATSARNPDDPEWEERIRLHRERRPDSWTTVETLDVGSVLRRHEDAPVLVDCLGVWITRVLDEAGAWTDEEGWSQRLAGRVDDLVDAVHHTRREVVMVSNEVGMGLVPETASGRLFRDELGRLNAAVAGACDEVWVCIAGIPKRWA
ncbi:bifunctional adenosylcobinamide kinase/adenosylcobinamide-phosphate guanylyltransferase [Acidipropionibacterium jensenii]|uniref:Adenosylcobinamide kinase n=1 Tax=Acidipropionibacterium jensenii TaxID=1749 RepID=A0A3T0RX97_9ACTN|nr:bifunctional adenosylcobinamide kinase/adenosylcobinamide-phosphate guanylyltransferase [Acidipropionibacterium jensenii]